MGCLKLTYRETYTALKVVRGGLYGVEKGCADAYRYGFNGKENDVETGTQDYGMRIYNPGIAKFLSVDPLASKFAFYSPYQYAGNKPIGAIDLDGLEEYWVTVYYHNNKYIGVVI